MHGTQSGQALPFGLALLLIGALGALVLYNTGQVATEKSRLANAADAAAYSGLVWQARALNFQAYTNRAMVANQVTMAQAVSLTSWTAYGAMTSERLALITSSIPGVNVLTHGLSVGMQSAARVMEPLSSVVVTIVDKVNKVLSGSQVAMYTSGFIATPEIVRTVAAASDPDFTADTQYAIAGLVRNFDDWQAFTDSVEEEDLDLLRERGDVVMRSRDEFTEERSWEFFENFWMYVTPLSRHKIYREGDTRLVALEVDGELRWEWRAVDTIALQSRFFRFLRSEKKEEVPIGWASAYANDDQRRASTLESYCNRADNRRSPDCDYWTNKNHRTERKANRASTVVTGYSGVQAYRTLSSGALTKEGHDPVIRLRTEIAVNLPDVRSSDDLTSDGVFDTDISSPGDKLSSISVAEVYYRRPESATRSGSAEQVESLSMEAANGYNPYWTVRLAPIELEERLLAVGLRLAEAGGSRASGVGASTLPAAFDGSRPGTNTSSDTPQELTGQTADLPTYTVPVSVSDDGIVQAAGAVIADGLSNGLSDGLSNDLSDGLANGAVEFTQLATAFGANASSLRDELGERTGLELPAIEGLEILDDPVGFVTDRLEDELESAAREIISGLGASVTGSLEDVQEQIQSEVPGAEELATAVAQAEVVAGQMRELRDEVSEAFEPVLTGRLARYGDSIRSINARLVILRADLLSASGDLDVPIQGTIDRLQVDLFDARVELLDDLTDSLMGIIRTRAPEELGDFFNRASTRGMVDALLDALDDGRDLDIGDVFPWAP